MTPMTTPPHSAEALCQEAEQQCGLSNWGDKRFVEPLQILLDSLARSAQLHRRGWKATVADLNRLLKNRLLIQQELDRDPKILQRPLPDPLFIVGMPRTGSTMLQNLLACDPAARSLRYYESHFPVLNEAGRAGDADPRIRMADVQLRMMHRLAPGFNKIHAMSSTAPEECSKLMEHSFVDTFFEIRNWVPDYSEWLEANESNSFYYEEFRTMLKLLGMADTQTHWVCKAPRHLSNIDPLVEVFPNAKLVWTNRDPAQSVPSVASLSATACSMTSDHIDKKKLGSFWLQRTSSGLRKGLEYRRNDVHDRYVDVEYEDLTADPIGTVKQIYVRLGYSYSEPFEENMELWLAENPINRHGKHRYSPEEYGLTKEEIRRHFA